MAKLYYNLIINQNTNWTIDMIPERWKAEVEELLRVHVSD